MARLIVYICREPGHEKLVEMVRDVLRRVKGKKPKLQVVRLKLERGEDFPIYLSQLEEMFGGVATAEFRKYRIESLPAVVFNDQLVLQGDVPSLEELEEALVYAGLKFAKERTVEAQLPEQPQLLPQTQSGRQAVAPIQHATVKTVKETQAGRALQPPPKVKIVEKLSPLTAEDKGVKVEQKIGVDTAALVAKKPEERAEPIVQPVLRPAPQEPPPGLTQPQDQKNPPPRPVPSAKGYITQEELLVNVPSTTTVPTQARARKLCRECVFYEPTTRKCLLYRAPIADPDKPICA